MPSKMSTFGGLAMLLATRAVAENTCVLKANPPAGKVCGTSGYLTNENSLDVVSGNPDDYSSPAACSLACSKRSTCASWYFGKSAYPFCEFHTDTVAAAGFYADPNSYYYAYDQACYDCGPKTVTCPASDGQQFTIGAATFNIHCGGDHYGGDIGFQTTATFEECMTTCASTMGCIDVAYNGNSCYMKGSIDHPRQNDAVWGAVLASSDKAAGAALTCPTSNGTTFTAASGASFVVQCGVDYYGGDMGSAYVNSFADCLQACDNMAGCLDVALHGNYCYMKNSVTSPNHDDNVWGAIRSDAKVRRDDEAVQGFAARRKRDVVVAPTSKDTPNVDDVMVSVA